MGIPDAPVQTGPYFFFSYARNDMDPYLKRFFQDLVQEVKRLAGAEEVSFRDLEDMEPGDNWPEVLARALQISRVLVAVYSKWYFSRPYCGKEIQVFLDRRQYRRPAVGEAEKITPVFWLSKAWLARYQLPPAPVGHIHYEHKDFPAEYLEHGLSIMAKNRRKAYTLFVDALAKRIIALAEEDPLPPHPELPNLERVRSAFETAAPPPTVATLAITEGPRLAQFLFLGDSAPAAAAPAGAVASDPWPWKPFGAESVAEIRSLLEAVVGPSYAYQRVAAAPDLRALLLDLRQRNVLPIVILDLPFLAVPAGREALASLLDDAEIVCGLLVTYDEQVGGAAAARSDLESWLQFGQRSRARLLEIVGSGKALREGLSRILLGLQQRTVENGQIHRVAEGEGPTERPLLRVPGKGT